MKYNELDFRKLYNKFVRIPMADRCRKYIKAYPDSDMATHILLYGSSDHTAGMSFSVICTANIDNDSELYFGTNLNVHTIIHAEDLVDEDVVILEDQNTPAVAYAQKIAM